MSQIDFPISYVDGIPCESIPLTNRGLAYGDGVFETLLIIRGEIPLWPLHHKRLSTSLLKLHIVAESSRIRSALDQALESAKKLDRELYVLKIIITRAEGGRGYQPSLEGKSSIITQLFPVSIDRSKYNGVSVHICSETLHPVSWAGLKTLNQLPYVLASNERVNTDYDEGILFSSSGFLIEATSRNVFIVKDDLIYTPMLDSCGVEGVLRQAIIDDTANKIGRTVTVKAITEAEFYDADEVFLTNTVTGIWPVISCENKHWPIGPVTRSLQSIYNSIFINEQ